MILSPWVDQAAALASPIEVLRVGFRCFEGS